MLMETRIQADAKRITKQDLVKIYEKHSAGLYRYAYRLLGDKHLAEEAVSETFSRFLQALRNGGGPSENVQAYLYRVAHNYITDYYRRGTPDSVLLDEDQHEDEHSNPVHLVSNKFEQERVRKALLQLPADQRNVILLRLVEEWPHEEVAALLDKSVEATRALQYRALAALRRLLIDEEEIL
jgi:RNA polymerase sigma-70 factor (ECF subfamily)